MALQRMSKRASPRIPDFNGTVRSYRLSARCHRYLMLVLTATCYPLPVWRELHYRNPSLVSSQCHIRNIVELSWSLNFPFLWAHPILLLIWRLESLFCIAGQIFIVSILQLRIVTCTIVLRYLRVSRVRPLAFWTVATRRIGRGDVAHCGLGFGKRIAHG